MKTFACTCGLTFGDLKSLRQHAKDKNKSLRCSCKTLFTSRKKLVAHAQQHGHPIMHEEEGGKPSTTQPLKERHLQCPHCPKKKPFDSMEALEQHTAALHSDTVPRNAKMQANQCPICENKFFRTAKDVTAHLKDVHKPAPIDTKAPIALRTRSKTGTKKSGSGDVARRKPHPCLTCGRRFMKAEYLLQHQISKHPQEHTTEVVDDDDSDTSPASSTSSVSGVRVPNSPNHINRNDWQTRVAMDADSDTLISTESSTSSDTDSKGSSSPILPAHGCGNDWRHAIETLLAAEKADEEWDHDLQTLREYAYEPQSDRADDDADEAGDDDDDDDHDDGGDGDDDDNDDGDDADLEELLEEEDAGHHLTYKTLQKSRRTGGWDLEREPPSKWAL